MNIMDITEKRTKYEPSLGDAHHWVEQLFPPHFTFQNLLENQTNTNELPNCLKKSPKSHRGQIYPRALKEVQQTERLQMRNNRHEQPIHEEENQIERCIWNERDISKLRTGFTEVEKDKWRLKQKLDYTEEKLEAEHEQRMKLQGLVEKLEKQLCLSKNKAAHQALVINDLKSESQKRNAQLRKLTLEVKEKEEEADRWKTSLKQAKEDMRQIVQERSKLAWEQERVRAQWKSEGERMEKAAQIENEAVLLRLQRELEQARADLHAEKESHMRSLTALEILRRHCSNK